MIYSTTNLMEITVEISMYPLRENYEDAILEFIHNTRMVSGLDVNVNPTATHIYGEYDLVMATLEIQVRKSFEKYGKVVFAFKVLNGNLSDSLKEKNL